MILDRIKGFILQYALVGSLFACGILGLGLAYSQYRLGNAEEVIENLVKWQDGIVNTTRLAAGSDDVTALNAGIYIQNLGIIRVELKNSVATQNNALQALERETVAAREVAARAVAQREGAIRRAATLEATLMQRAEAPAADTNLAVRETQDDVFEGGF